MFRAVNPGPNACRESNPRSRSADSFRSSGYANSALECARYLSQRGDLDPQHGVEPIGPIHQLAITEIAATKTIAAPSVSKIMNTVCAGTLS